MSENKKHYKKIALFLFYGALTVAILATILSFNDISEIFKVMRSANAKYIIIAVALLVIYVLLYPLTTCILAKAQKLQVHFLTGYTIAMTEHFFNGITPFSTGGQPFQVYSFKRVGVKASDGTGLLMMNFIIFMIVTNLFAMLSLIYATKFVNTVSMTVLATVGFTINFGVLAFLISLATSKRLRGMLSGILNLLCRIKFFKKFLEPRIPQLNEYFEQVQIAFKTLIKKVGTFIVCVLIKIVTMACYYAITFFVLRALNVVIEYKDIFFVICGTSFAITMVVFVPTPGSSGGIEFAFGSVLANIGGGLSAAVSYGGMLIWRLLGYYLVMGISFVFYIGLEIYLKVLLKRKNDLQSVQIVSGEEVIPVVYSGNNNIFHGIILSVISMCEHTARTLRVYILTMDLSDRDERFAAVSDQQIASLDAVLKSYNSSNCAIKIDVTADFISELSESKNLKNSFTPYAMLRLFLDLYDMPDKLIYVDVDTMCCSDIAQLYDLNIEQYEFAAALDKVGHVWVRPGYCNSGVMLINHKRMCETGLFRRARKMILRRKLFMPDQSALNFLAKKKLILPYKFNEQRNIKSDTVIKHFCQYFKWFGPFFKLENIKQWERDKVHNILNIHDFDCIYEVYDKFDAIYNFKE